MRIAVAGSSGLIGSSLCSSLHQDGHQVLRLLRGSSNAKSDHQSVLWDPAGRQIELEKMEGLDAVINLAGANIADCRWTSRYKGLMRQSRIDTARFLCDTFAKLEKPPRIFFCSSAVGYYGHYPSGTIVDETSPPAGDFLAKLCVEWEQAASFAGKMKIRVVCLRTGMVLSAKGGALKKMLPAFRCGLGGRLGSGQQMISWIFLDDLIGAVKFLLASENLSGAVNAVSPKAVSNAEFTETLGKALHRPAVFPVPAWGLKILFGEMAESLLLNGAHVYPKKLLESGFRFDFPDLAPALEMCLKRK